MPSVAFTIVYTQDERAKLAKTAMEQFKEIWGHYPRSVASWNLDAFTMAYLNDRYKVDAYAVCRDQIATDGFTIWGAPIAGYYPSKVNCWSPAIERCNQLSTPTFRMLGQDPVYYYQKEWTVPGSKPNHKKHLDEPDTMEPAWTGGQTPSFVAAFLNMMASAPSQKFAYCQLGQENTFQWNLQEDGYQMQMKALADLRISDEVYIESLGCTGRRFKQAFHETPTQAQVQLQDPFNNRESPENSIWYQSRFYRANMHLKGGFPFLRDVTVYSDGIAQPFLDEATRQACVEQTMPAIMDSYHWSKNPGMHQEGGAFFYSEGQRLRTVHPPHVIESETALEATMAINVCSNAALCVKFKERTIVFSLRSKESYLPLTIGFEWDQEKAVAVEVREKRVRYSVKGVEYYVDILEGCATITATGWMWVSGKKGAVLSLAQTQ